MKEKKTVKLKGGMDLISGLGMILDASTEAEKLTTSVRALIEQAHSIDTMAYNILSLTTSGEKSVTEFYQENSELCSSPKKDLILTKDLKDFFDEIFDNLDEEGKVLLFKYLKNYFKGKLNGLSVKE